MGFSYKSLYLAIAILSVSVLAQTNTGGLGNTAGTGNRRPQNGFDREERKERMIHGILASVAFLILFPLGSIAMATLRGRWAYWVHVVSQMLGWFMFIAVAALGFRMLGEVRIRTREGRESLIDIERVRYHPIIGIILFVLVLLQPALGWFHHRQFKIYQRRTIVSYLHLVNGRLIIILGMINGGLGLKVSRASKKFRIDYGVVAGVIGVAWLAVTIFTEVRRAKGGDFWRTGRSKNNGKSVRMDRIDKAVRAGSERDSFEDVL